MIRYFVARPDHYPNGLVRATAGASGFDLCANVDGPVLLHPGRWAVFHCGLHLEMPLGIEAQIRPRSGLALRDGITVLNAPGTIDSDYRGQVGATLINHGTTSFKIEPGMRVAQLVFAPVVIPGHQKLGHERGVATFWPYLTTVAKLDDLAPSLRGDGGFGSTGQ